MPKSTKEFVDLAYIKLASISSKTNYSCEELVVPLEVEYSTTAQSIASYQFDLTVGHTLAAEVVEEASQPMVDAAFQVPTIVPYFLLIPSGQHMENHERFADVENAHSRNLV